MRRKSWMIVAVLLGAAILSYFLFFRATEPPPAPEGIVFTAPVPTAHPTPPPVPVLAPVPETMPAEPVIAHPLAPAPSVDTLPAPDHSDAAIFKSVIQVLGNKWKSFLIPETLIHNIVVTVDNLPRDYLPEHIVPLKRATGAFLTSGQGADLSISPYNQKRYSAYILLIESVDTAKLVALYRQLYPVFQRAYVQIGYPKAYFNDRLVEAIDDLLAAPEIEGPIQLVQPKVLYQFADPKIQALSSGQRIMIRIGRDNAERLKRKLREIRLHVAQAAKVS